MRIFGNRIGCCSLDLRKSLLYACCARLCAPCYPPSTGISKGGCVRYWQGRRVYAGAIRFRTVRVCVCALFQSGACSACAVVCFEV